MKGSKQLYLCTKDEIQQRASMVLQKVHYVIFAHIVMTDKVNNSDNIGKFLDIATRRLRKGQCYHMPYFKVQRIPQLTLDYMNLMKFRLVIRTLKKILGLCFMIWIILTLKI